ncbi:hypothetical protein LYSBPC_19390 [Lysinibacillus piscis]|uniref:Uncharacterized protein n=1 Tax=Lysinibacillus piscis TaxID=2518931 RepID=A0ABQ5NKB5_9BACI|nr:hypothetical protein LYSBPC_19390 [Lysinibacillus sp. KH24]
MKLGLCWLFGAKTDRNVKVTDRTSKQTDKMPKVTDRNSKQVDSSGQRAILGIWLVRVTN